MTTAFSVGSGSSSEFRIETLTDGRSMRALQPEWDHLLEQAGELHPFTSFDWVDCWWQAFGGDKELHLVTLRRGGELAGVAPLMRRRGRIYGLPVRRLEAIGNAHTPRWDLLAGPQATDVVAALWRHLATTRADWDVLLLSQLPAGSRTLEQLPPLAEADGMLTGRWTSSSSPRVSVTDTYAAYRAGLPRKHRANLRNRARRLAAVGAVEAEMIVGPEGLAPALDEGFRIEASGWKGAERTAIASAPERRRFYEMFAARAASKGWLRLRFLKVGGRRVAFMYSLRYAGEEYIVKQGFEPSFAAYSPSALLAERVLEEAFATASRGVDFLGDDESWKLRWTQERRSHYWLFVFPDRLRARVIHAAKFRVLPALRTWAALARRSGSATEGS